MNQDPNTHPIRYYHILRRLEVFQRELSIEELQGAAKILGILAEEFEIMHFDKKMDLDQRTIVKTITEVYENVLEDALQKHQMSRTK